MEKIDDFDLIIFDRYKRRGFCRDHVGKYLDMCATVERFGCGRSDFASANSITVHRSGCLFNCTYRACDRRTIYPISNRFEDRHPVTRGLPEQDNWGAWLRQIEVILIVVKPDVGCG